MKTARSPIALDYRFFWTMVGGNFGGALLTVAYFRFLHPAALTHSSLSLRWSWWAVPLPGAGLADCAQPAAPYRQDLRVRACDGVRCSCLRTLLL